MDRDKKPVSTYDLTPGALMDKLIQLHCFVI